MSAFTLDQMMHPEVITGLIKRYGEPASLFQKLFSMELGDPATDSVPGMFGQKDLIDPTRFVGTIRNNSVGPRRVIPKQVGVSNVTCYRYYEAVQLLEQKLYPMRQLGGPVGGAGSGMAPNSSYYKEQVKYLGGRVTNLREFAISRTLFGGFALKAQNSTNGQNIIPVEYGAGDYDIDSGLPASNTGQVALASGGGNIITATWANAATDIAAQVNNINEAMLFVSGMPLKHVIITTQTYNHMQANSVLQATGGSSVSTFLYRNPSQRKGPDGKLIYGETVRFRAIPNVDFHVYDAHLMLEDSNQKQSDQRTRSKTFKVLPENKALFLPEPDSSWMGWQAGSEPIRKTPTSDSEIQVGYDTWNLPLFEPVGQEIRMMDIGMPYLKVRSAPIYATVIF